MTRIAQVALTAMLVTTTMVGTYVSAPVALAACMQERAFGDVTGPDGSFVEAADAMFMLHDLADNLLPLTYCGPEDVDCSGEFDVVDPLKVLRYVAGLSYSQIEPCPAIGEFVSH